MDAAAAERSTCTTCGAALEETTAGELGCLPCLLRVGLTNTDEASQDRHRTDRFGAYVVEDDENGSGIELGRGASGVTYRAIDTALQRKVALKIIASDASSRNASERERFMRGARAAAALRHESVATIYHFGLEEESGEYFYAMELVEGETLEERVRRTGPLDVRTTIAIARQVVSALGAAERCGVIHRDLKPGNIMLVRQEDGSRAPQVKVIDFGLAKVIGEVADPMTVTQGGFVGTPAFASPEQFAHKPLDARSDIYSLGATLWFALTGRTPFARQKIEEIRAEQISGTLPLEQLRAARVSKRLMSILQSMLAPEPAARPNVAQLAERLRRCQQRKGRVYVAIAAAILLLAGIVYSLGHRPRANPATFGQKSLAVIPFTDLSREPDSHFFVYGIRTGITSRLSKIAQLKVVTSNVNPTSDDTPESVQQLADALDVPMVLQGTLKKEGEKFELKMRLTDVRSRREIWSQSYERKFSGVEEIERDVAAQAAAALGLKLNQPQQRAVNSKGTDDPRAYEAYLKGRYVWLQRHSDAYVQAKEYFEQAIALDPDYANAYVGLADADQFLAASAFGVEHAREYYAAAKEACRRALALNPDLAEAHASVALIAMNYEWDWALAEREYKRAIELDPSNALIHDWYAEFERAVGRADASAHQIEVARQLDPLSPLINCDVGKLLYFARRYQDAITQLEETIRMDPNFSEPHIWLGYTFASAGRFDEAVQEFTRLSPEGQSIWQSGWIAYVYGLQGKKAEAERLAQLVKRDAARAGHSDRFALVLACVGAGDKDGAFATLENEYAAHSVTISSLKLAPYFDSLRSDPRFVDLLRRAHLAP